MGKSYRDLVAWQKAMDLVTAVYRLTASFPREEIYALASQMRRAAVSIPSNIAEGQERHGRAEFRHFLRQANGPLMELETQASIAERLGYASADTVAVILQDAAEIGRVINGLIHSLENWLLATGY
jgi:four helix bundle protein